MDSQIHKIILDLENSNHLFAMSIAELQIRLSDPHFAHRKELIKSKIHDTGLLMQYNASLIRRITKSSLCYLNTVVN